MFLSIPPTATVTVSQQCAVSAIDYTNYTERSGTSPLAQIAITCDVLTEADWQILKGELDAAKGASPVQIPFVGGARQFLVQEYQQKPLLYGELTEINFTAIEQRDVLVPLPTDIPTVIYPAWYDSNSTTTFKTRRSQFNGGFQSSQSQGETRLSVDTWNIVFHLSFAAATALDATLNQLRGIFPFYWHSEGNLPDPLTGLPPTLVNPDLKLQWLCDQWQVTYDSTDFCVFTGKFSTYSDKLNYSMLTGSFPIPANFPSPSITTAAIVHLSEWYTSSFISEDIEMRANWGTSTITNIL
jgi:phage-related protein